MSDVSDNNLAAALSLRFADNTAVNPEDANQVAFILYQALVGRRDLCEELWNLGIIEEEYFHEMR